MTKCKGEQLALKNPKDRWSAERYKSAETNLLEVMNPKGAVADEPILRPEQRAEARKRVGETGLLGHLLKHMAGKIAQGGTEPLRRRHNSDGAMEYRLESADLVNTREQSGVKELRFLKKQVVNLESKEKDVALASNKMLSEDIMMLRRKDKDISKKEKSEASPIRATPGRSREKESNSGGGPLTDASVTLDIPFYERDANDFWTGYEKFIKNVMIEVCSGDKTSEGQLPILDKEGYLDVKIKIEKKDTGYKPNWCNLVVRRPDLYVLGFQNAILWDVGGILLDSKVKLPGYSTVQGLSCAYADVDNGDIGYYPLRNSIHMLAEFNENFAKKKYRLEK